MAAGSIVGTFIGGHSLGLISELCSGADARGYPAVLSPEGLRRQ